MIDHSFGARANDLFSLCKTLLWVKETIFFALRSFFLGQGKGIFPSVQPSGQGNDLFSLCETLFWVKEVVFFFAAHPSDQGIDFLRCAYFYFGSRKCATTYTQYTVLVRLCDTTDRLVATIEWLVILALVVKSPHCSYIQNFEFVLQRT